MNVLSLFDGMACGRIALKRAGIHVTNYYASEIDKSAIKVAKHNWPEIQHIGDVTQVRARNLPKIDLIIGGSPCQGFSFAGKQLNFEDPRSKLFFEFVRLLKECRMSNPDVKFMLENVNMKQEHRDVISNKLQCEPAYINSSLVSAQNRKRWYWSNFFSPGFEPDNKNIMVKDILEHEPKTCSFNIKVHNPVFSKNYVQWDITGKGHKSQDQRAFFIHGKFGTLANARATTKRKIWLGDDKYRNLTWTECERLQTVPDGYTQVEGVSEGQALCMLGNGWTVDVIAHIFKQINRSIG